MIGICCVLEKHRLDPTFQQFLKSELNSFKIKHCMHDFIPSGPVYIIVLVTEWSCGLGF